MSAVLLNITPDHLDRHGSLEEYGRREGGMFENQTEEDAAVLTRTMRRRGTPPLRPPVFWFSRRNAWPVAASCVTMKLFSGATGPRPCSFAGETSVYAAIITLKMF